MLGDAVFVQFRHWSKTSVSFLIKFPYPKSERLLSDLEALCYLPENCTVPRISKAAFVNERHSTVAELIWVALVQ